jgi:splicing factor U2AF subunit
MGMAVNPNLSRQSRRLYIGSITPEINEQNLADFFNNKMTEMKIGTGAPGNPVLAVQCNYEKSYAFVEVRSLWILQHSRSEASKFRSAEDATAAMAFDGIMFLNGPLKIRRPKDYGGMEMSGPASFHVPGVVSTNVPDSANKVFVGGLPSYLNEEQVMELLKSFGELKAFNLVRDNGTGPSKVRAYWDWYCGYFNDWAVKQGFAFFEYVDPAVTDVAIAALSGMTLGDRQLVIQRASVGAKAGQPGFPDLPYEQFPEIPRPIMPAGDVSEDDARVLLMLNMVTPDDLVDDDEYVEIVDDVRSEVSKYGAVEDVRIPPPSHGRGHHPSDQANGVGRVYVKFVDSMGALSGMKALAGRSFAGRSIIATLLGEDSQTSPPLDVIFAPQPDAPPPLPLEDWLQGTEKWKWKSTTFVSVPLGWSLRFSISLYFFFSSPILSCKGVDILCCRRSIRNTGLALWVIYWCASRIFWRYGVRCRRPFVGSPVLQTHASAVAISKVTRTAAIHRSWESVVVCASWASTDLDGLLHR